MSSKKEILADKQISNAMGLAQKGKYEEAIIELKKSLDNDPNRIDTAKFIAYLLSELKRNKEALEYSNIALKLDSHDANLHQIRGKIFKMLAMYDEAIDSLNKSLEIKPNNCDVLTLQGNSYMLKKDYENAIKCYDKALSINKDYGLALNRKIDALKKLGRLGEAEKLQIGTKAPKLMDITALNAKALKYMSENNILEALKCYHVMVKLQPTLSEIRQQIKEILDSIEDALKNYGITRFNFPKWVKKSKFYNIGKHKELSDETLNERIHLVLGLHQLEMENASISNFQGDIIIMIKDYHESLERDDLKEEVRNDRIRQINLIEIPSWKDKGLLFYSLGRVMDLPAVRLMSSVGLFLNMNKIHEKANMFPLNENDMILCIETIPGSFEPFQKAFNINPIGISFDEKNSEEKFKICKNCDTQNMLKSKFCTKCGNRF